MKAITIHQPWASLIAHGHKRFETRGWRTHYRGPIAIHAGLKSDFQTIKMLAINYTRFWHEITPLPTGCIIAVAELISCRKVVSSGRERGSGIAWLEDGYMILGNEVDFGDYTPGRYAWELANIHRLKEPIPVRGRQGLWNWEPPDDWKCVVCNGFVVGGGLCEDCIGQETEIAMDLGLI